MVTRFPGFEYNRYGLKRQNENMVIENTNTSYDDLDNNYAEAPHEYTKVFSRIPGREPIENEITPDTGQLISPPEASLKSSDDIVDAEASHKYAKVFSRIPGREPNKSKIKHEETDCGSFIKFTRDLTSRIVKRFLSDFNFTYIGNLLHVFSGKYYEPLEMHAANVFIHSYLRIIGYDVNSRNDIDSIYRLLLIQPSIQRKDDEYEKWLINFNNGVYDVLTNTMSEHSPSNSFRYAIKANYYPEIDPDDLPNEHFTSYLKKMSGGDTEIEKLFSEIFGYCLSDMIDAKAGIIFFGVPNSGKTLALKLLIHLLGKENCSSVPFQDLNKRFMPAELFGKKLNACSELPDTPINDVGMFKALTGGDVITAERKNQHPFQFVNKAKLIFACNKLPQLRTPELSGAFFDRIVILPFNYSIAKKDQDKELFNKLVSQESDYIVYWAMEGLKRLIRRNLKFRNCNASKNALDVYRNTNNTIMQFVQEECILRPDARAFSGDLYASYIQFCDSNKFKRQNIFSKNDFSDFLEIEYKLSRKRIRIGEDNRNGFIGITQKST